VARDAPASRSKQGATRQRQERIMRRMMISELFG
jgi:hypothetical protein